MSTIALIPARGGSKGLPNKNLTNVGGKSLVASAIDLARSVGRVDEVIVSSDSGPILDEAASWGAIAVKRPENLSADTTATLDVILHHLAERPDVSVVVILQPTSPLRVVEDVERCLDALEDAATAVTVTPLDHPAEWLYRIGDDGRMQPLLGWNDVPPRRQDAGPVFTPNGAVYAARAEHLRAGGKLLDEGTRAIVMPRERSVDIDDATDLALARILHESRVGKA